MKKRRKVNEKDLRKELRKLTKEIKNSYIRDEREYWESRLEDEDDSKKVWRASKEMLGENKNLGPGQMMKYDDAGNLIPIRGCQEVAKEFNEYFCKKVETLREKAREDPKVDPVERLKEWIEEKNEDFPRFEFISF